MAGGWNDRSRAAVRARVVGIRIEQRRSSGANVPGIAQFTIPAYHVDRDWALFDVGAAMDFGKLTGFITGSATAGKGDGDWYGITIGVRIPL